MKIGQKLVGSISINDSGNGFFTSEEVNKTLFVYKTNAGKSLHLDTVRVEIIKGKRDRFEAKVIEVVERFKTTFVGILDVGPDFALLDADNKKIHVDFYVNLADLNGAKDGEKVVIELLEWKEEHRTPNAKVISVLGEAGDNDTEIHSILAEYDLPYEFPQSVLDEADRIDFSISDEEVAKRRDMRDVLTFTIDGETARDLDDALSVQWVDGELEVGVHIADVSHYVKRDSEIDKEAYSRGNSVYLVDRCVPMLPHVLSNNVCSLNPNTDKLVYSFIFKFDKNGEITNKEFCKGIINSNYRLTYIEVEKVITGGETHSKDLKNSLLVLDKMAKLNRRRRTKNSLSFNSGEVKFVLDDNSKPIGVTHIKNLDAHRLIEEFMVLTNRKVCEFLSDKKVPLIHRAHGEPDLDRLLEIKNYLTNIGITFMLEENNIKKSINNLLNTIKDTPYENIVNDLIVRSQQKAVYQTDNIGHWGMGLEYYTHVTSPIRRYSDFIIHQILNNILENGGYITD